MKRLTAVLILLILLLASCTAGKTETLTDGETAESTAVHTADGEETDTPTGTGGETQDGETQIPAPTLIFSKNISKEKVLVAGKCEADCRVKVRGSTVEEKTVIPDGDGFVFEVTLPSGGEDVLSIIAYNGSGESKPLSVSVKYDRGAEDMKIFATDDSRLFQNAILPDINKTNRFTQGQIKALQYGVRTQLEELREATGKNTEIIYLFAPYSLSVYSDGFSVADGESRYEQAVKTLSDIEGVTVIDTSEILNRNKSAGKLYYNLDTHWTELGGYFGYKALMDHISQSYPAATPHSLDDYETVQVCLDYTDMIYYADAVGSGMTETAPFLHAKYTPKTPYDTAKAETANISEFSKRFFAGKSSVTHVDGQGLPTAQVIADSYLFNCIPYIAEHFSTLACQPVWHYTPDYGMAEEYKPDYLIYILNERTVGKLLEQ